MTSVDFTEPAEDSPAQKCGSCDGAPVQCWCVDCNEALCHDCVSAHRRVTVTRRHKLLNQAPPEVLSISPTKFCSLHPSEALRLFCFRCNQITCRDCQLVAHKNHSFEFISKAVESLKKQLGSSIDPLKEQMQASRRSLMDMEERLAVLSQHETFIKTKLQKNFSALAEFLSRRLEKVLKEIQKIHDWERQKIHSRMLKVRELQQSCMAVTAAAVQAQDVTDLLELLGCMEQIKPQVKDLISQDSAPPKTMACLKVIADQKSMDTILQFGKIEVSWVPFSASQTTEKASSSSHEVLPPTSSSSFQDIAAPTSSSFSNVAPPTSSSFSSISPPTSSSFSSIAPQTFSSSFRDIAPSTSSSFCDIATPNSFSYFRDIAPPNYSSFSSIEPPTSSSFSDIAPPTSSSFSCIAPSTSFSSFSSIAPPTSSSFSSIAPPTSSSFSSIAPPTSSSFSSIAPPTSSSSFSSIAPPTSSSFSSIAPPTSSSTCSSFFTLTPPLLASHSPPSSLSSSCRRSTFGPPVHTGDAPPAPRRVSPVVPLTAPTLPREAKHVDSACSSQLQPSSAPPSAQTIHTPTSSFNFSAPSSSSLDPPSVAPPQTTAAAASKVRINVISRSEVAALSRLFQWPIKQGDPPKEKLPRSVVPQGGWSADASSCKHPPKKTKSSGGVSTLLFHSTAPQSRNLFTSSCAPSCSPPITPVSDPDPASQQQPSGFSSGGLAASELTAPSLPSPPPSLLPNRALMEPLRSPPPDPQSPLKDQNPPHTLQRSSLRDRPSSQKELRPDPGSAWGSRQEIQASPSGPCESEKPCSGGGGSSSAAEPPEPVSPQTLEDHPASAFPVEPEPPEKPASPPTTEEPTSIQCGGLDPDGMSVRNLRAGTHEGGSTLCSAPEHRDSRLLHPQVCLFRLPVSWPGPGRPLPRFRLTLGDAEDEIYMQEISQNPAGDPSDQPLDFTGSSLTNDSSLYNQNLDSIKDFTEPLSLEILSCSTCGASDASKICVSCGRGYHQDCHVPPVGPDIWSEWICSLCQDLSDPTDPFSSDRPDCPQTSGLSLLDQRKCETLVLHLLVESCGRLSESGFLSDLTQISERLTCRRPPGFQRAEDLVSELWTLMEESSQNDILNELQDSFQRKMKETFGSEFCPLFPRALNTNTPPGGGSSLLKCDASGPKEVDVEMPKVRREAELMARRSKLEVLRRRLRDFLDMKQLPPGKRMKPD